MALQAVGRAWVPDIDCSTSFPAKNRYSKDGDIKTWVGKADNIDQHGFREIFRSTRYLASHMRRAALFFQSPHFTHSLTCNMNDACHILLILHALSH